jgi:hypothetical protein
MALVSIADLGQSQEVRTQYVQHAMQLSVLWHKWKEQQSGNRDVTVAFRGEKGRKPGIHASEISKCQRKMVYSLMGTERIVSARNVNMQDRFDVGTAMHAVIQKQFYEMCDWLGGGITFEDEAKIHPGLGGVAEKWNMHSSCDGIFTFWHNCQPYLRVGLEIKTQSGPEFEKLKEPFDDHKEQGCMYMKALDIPLIWFLYYNKSNSNYTPSEAPYLLQFNSVLWGQLEQRFQAATCMANDKHLPAKQEGMPCSWCPFAYTCKPAYLNRSSSNLPTASAPPRSL